MAPRSHKLAYLLAPLLAVGLAACGGSSTKSTSQGGTTGTPHKGGTLTILTHADQISHLDPQRNYVGEDFAFDNAYLVRTLTAYKPSPDAKESSQLVGDLATDTGTASNAGKTWSFTLRDGVKWEDGTAVTCADVKYGVSRTFAQSVITDGPTYALQLLDIPQAADGTSVYKGPYDTSAKNNQAAFDKALTCSADNKTVTFHLNRPAGDFNYTAALPALSPVPKAKDTGEKYDDRVFSDGPYKVASYTKGQELVLDRNPNWNASSDPYRPALPDKIVTKFSLDASVIDQRLIASGGEDKNALSREVIGAEHLTQVFSGSQYASRSINSQNPYVYMLAINTSKVTNLKQRQAIMAALDRAQMIKVNGGSYAGDIADGVISPTLGIDYAKTGLWDTLLGQKVPDSGDPELAKKLIAESGAPMPVITYDYGQTPVYDKEAAAIQQSLSRAGITVKLNPLPSGQRNSFELNPQTENELEWTAWASDWPNASTVVPELFAGTGGWPLARSNDKTFNAKSLTAKSDLDRSKQSEAWKSLNTTAMTNAWAIPIRYGRDQRLTGSGVGAVHGDKGHVYLWPPDGSWPYADLYVK